MKRLAFRTQGCRSLAVGLALIALGGQARASAAEIDLIIEILGLEPGMTVADVGAGSGAWAVQLADHLGPAGRVWATEVDREEIEAIERRASEALHDNVTVVQGDQTSSGLPSGCCDAVLLRLVYHHFQRPDLMRADLRRALRPGGLLAIVDITPQSSWRHLPGVPERGGHGIPPDDLIREMTGAGFSIVSRQDDWNGDGDRFCIVFRR